MDSKVILCLLLFTFCGGEAYKILVAFPVATKSLHHLMSSLGLELAKAGHSVTHLTSFDAVVTHPNIEHLQPDDFTSDLYVDNVFSMDSQMAFLDWVDTLLTKIPHKFWKDPEIWKLYNRRNEFDAIISTHYINEIILPFLDGYNGIYVIVCTPGIEYRCLSYNGNWPSPAIVSNFALPYDEFMTFYERIHNSITFAIEKVVELTIVLPNFLKTIKTYFPHVKDIAGYYKRNHLTLINGHFALDSPVPLLPNQIEIGTINAKKAEPLSKDLQKVYDGAGPEGVIYFSMGSFVKGKDIPLKYKKILLEAFGQLKHTVIWKYEENDLDLPPNVITRKWLPQQDILGHPKTKIFMSHCGNLGTQEAKFHGVPVLALPLIFDQPRNAARLVRKGYGVTLKWNEMTVDKLLEAVHTITKDSTYYDRMKNVSKILQDQKDSPAERAVWWVEYVIRHKGAPHLQYAGQRLHFLQYIMVDVVAFWSLVLCLLLVTFIWSCKRIWRKCFGSPKLKKD